MQILKKKNAGDMEGGDSDSIPSLEGDTVVGTVISEIL